MLLEFIANRLEITGLQVFITILTIFNLTTALNKTAKRLDPVFKSLLTLLILWKS